jgi:putative tryptophan/tyrosine transport system substrate-binding protein
MICRARVAVRLATVFVFALCLFLSASSNGNPRMFTIGVVSDVQALSPVLDGFKAGIAKLGYIEGKDVTYLVGEERRNKKELAAEVRGLLSKKIDLFFTIGNQATLAAMEAIKGTDMPILAAPLRKPVESGLVESINHPGGNVTGVLTSDCSLKTLEWMKTIIPGIKKVYLPYNPDDKPSKAALIGIEQTASRLGITIVYHEIHSIKEAIDTLENFPQDIQAVFRVPSPTLDERIGDLSNAAMKKGIPVGAMYPLDRDALIIFSDDFYEIGKQAARLAHQIRLGIRPSEIPIESTDVYLTVNLKTAAKIRLTISDDVLFQAKTIIR